MVRLLRFRDGKFPSPSPLGSAEARDEEGTASEELVVLSGIRVEFEF